MKRPPKTTGQKAMAELLYSTFFSLIRAHAPVGYPLPLAVHLPPDCRSASPSKPGESTLRYHMVWPCLLTWQKFKRLLRVAVRRTLALSLEPRDCIAPSLPLSVIAACRVATDLLEELDCRNEDVIRVGKITVPDAVAGTQYDSLNRLLLPVARKYTSRMVESLEKRASVIGSGARILRFVFEGSIVRVEWLDAHDVVVRQEPLEGFLQAISDSHLKQLELEPTRLKLVMKESWKIRTKVLREASTKFDEAIRWACVSRKSTGIRLCTIELTRNFRLDVWLSLDPRVTSESQGVCTLSVNRGCRDFVLIDADSNKYYFPPCLLSARVSFPRSGPVVLGPVVRQPRGGFFWSHPFTEALHTIDPFQDEICDYSEMGIMYAPSQEAMKLLPQLARRTDRAHEESIRIKDFQPAISSLQQQLEAATIRRDGTDILSVFLSLHDSARMALTRGHKDNLLGGRMKLLSGNITYLLERQPVHGQLAKRVFVYSHPSTSLVAPFAVDQRQSGIICIKYENCFPSNLRTSIGDHKYMEVGG
jgi:hypothetical protein